MILDKVVNFCGAMKFGYLNDLKKCKDSRGVKMCVQTQFVDLTHRNLLKSPNFNISLYPPIKIKNKKMTRPNFDI